MKCNAMKQQLFSGLQLITFKQNVYKSQKQQHCFYRLERFT